MSDAAHMLSDVSAFLMSIFATWAATQPSTWHYSFGYHRAEILGALISVLTIWAVTGALVFEAFQRTINPVRVDGKCEWGGWGRCCWWTCMQLVHGRMFTAAV
jgi:zinc transporter 2